MDNKQAYMKPRNAPVIVARTPDEGGLDLNTLILALTEIKESLEISEDELNCLTVIFDDSDGQTSWTIQQVAFDGDWIRFS